MRTEKRRLRTRAIDDGEAFLRDFRHGFVLVKDGDAEAFGEEFVAGATSNEPIGELARDELLAVEAPALILDPIDDELDLLDLR
jgi:hypothetical protein